MPLTVQQKEELKNLYPQKGKFWCAAHFGVSEAVIRQAASSLRLRQDRTSDFFKDWQTRAAKSKIGKKRPEHSSRIKELWIINREKMMRAATLRGLKNRKRIVKNCVICDKPFEIIQSNTHQKSCLSPICKRQATVSIWKRNPHPRGALGLQHTKETREILSKKSKRAWADPKYILKSKEYRQAASDRFQKRIHEWRKKNPGKWTSPYTNTTKGWREIEGKKYFFKSRWEMNAARLLSFQKREWEYEPKTFWFEKIKRGVRSYTPDFFLPKENIYIEVKGWMDTKSKTKLKRMAKYYPNTKIELWDEDFFRALKRQGIGKLVPGWE